MRTDPRPGDAAFSLPEVLVAVTLLAIGALALLSVTGYSLGLDGVNRETAVATEAARRRIEALRTIPFEDVFAELNDDPDDDPRGIGSGPGSTFTVPASDGGLTMHGEYVLPQGPDGSLREDGNVPVLGLPRDLDGDGDVDDADHRDDYLILPVVVRLTWDGARGSRSIEVHGVLLP